MPRNPGKEICRHHRCGIVPARFLGKLSSYPIPMRTLANHSPLARIASLALGVFLLDQLAKRAVLRYLGYAEAIPVVPGFFKLVHWQNTGAAWSLFRGANGTLAVVALVAIVVLYLARHHFGARKPLGQLALGLIFGGILGNLLDRLLYGHVVDFIYFYVNQRAGGGEAGFPAFNVADSAICIGVGLVFWNSLRDEAAPMPSPASPASPAPP